jgi:hypothetical protein
MSVFFSSIGGGNVLNYLENMSNTPSRSQSENFSEKVAMQTSTPTVDQPNLPLLFKYNEEHNETMSHLDENNENDAVGKDFFFFSS